MTLWIFGDSFSVRHRTEDNIHPVWFDILADNLGIKDVEIYSEWGVANEFIFGQFLNQYENFKERDVIIVQLTEQSRQWFFKDIPNIANIHNIKHMDKNLSKERHKAIKEYITHLDFPIVNEIRYIMLVHALKNICTIMDKYNILVLPGFHEIFGVKGTLLEVCENEFISKDSADKWYKTHGIDPRTCHLSEPNHIILAEKITNCFLKGETIDLTIDFHKNLL